MHVVTVDVAHALRMMEACLFVTAIDETYFAVTYNAHAFMSFFIDKNNSVVACVRY